MKRLGSWLFAGALAAGAYAQEPPQPPAPPEPAKPARAAGPARKAVVYEDVRIAAGENGEPDQVIVRTKDGKTIAAKGPQTTATSVRGGGGFGGGGFGGSGSGPKALAITVDPMNQLQAVKGYITTMGEYSRTTADATTTAIGAVMQAADMLREKGADAQIDYFNRVLGEAQNDTVKRAIRMQLIDAYKRAGQGDKALDELKEMILAANAPARAAEHNDSSKK